jgi:trans-AT polyketide synthase, acyltransferase and oxidoreductase domains
MTGEPHPPRRHTEELRLPSSQWLVRLRPRPDARVRLICFTSAGAGASSYGRWPEHLSADVDAWAVQLPGRETRRREQALTDLIAIADEVAARLVGLVDLPLALFGHSMGALVAFEVARRLQAQDRRVLGLFVSGRAAPHLRHGPEGVDTLPDMEFLDAMDHAYGGVPALLREDDEFRELYLPPLRADATAVWRYRHVEGPLLECPIRVFGGVDDGSATHASLAAWDAYTGSDTTVTMFPGDHFYVNTARPELTRLISTELDDIVETELGRSVG